MRVLDQLVLLGIVLTIVSTLQALHGIVYMQAHATQALIVIMFTTLYKVTVRQTTLIITERTLSTQVEIQSQVI